MHLLIIVSWNIIIVKWQMMWNIVLNVFKQEINFIKDRQTWGQLELLAEKRCFSLCPLCCLWVSNGNVVTTSFPKIVEYGTIDEQNTSEYWQTLKHFHIFSLANGKVVTVSLSDQTTVSQLARTYGLTVSSILAPSTGPGHSQFLDSLSAGSKYWPLIVQHRSRDLNTGLLLDNPL